MPKLFNTLLDLMKKSRVASTIRKKKKPQMFTVRHFCLMIAMCSMQRNDPAFWVVLESWAHLPARREQAGIGCSPHIHRGPNLSHPFVHPRPIPCHRLQRLRPLHFIFSPKIAWRKEVCRRQAAERGGGAHAWEGLSCRAAKCVENKNQPFWTHVRR